MDLAASSPVFEAGLTSLREAGLAGMSREHAENEADSVLERAWTASSLSGEGLSADSLTWWAVGAEEALLKSYETGLRTAEAKSCAAYQASVIFDDLEPGASRADFVRALVEVLPDLPYEHAERAVDRVVRSRIREANLKQLGPHPTDVFATIVHEESRFANERRLAVKMHEEGRAARPKHDPTPAYEPLTPVQLMAAADANVEARRAIVGMPSGVLRTIDYEPGRQHTAPAWLVKGLLPHRGLGLLVGESQSGKSFLAIHAAVCVARGLPFFGKKVKPGAVLYIAAEGGSGVLPRIQAADEAAGGLLPANHMLRPAGACTAAPIKVVVETPNLSRDGDAAALTRTLRAAALAFEQEGHALSLVVVDTWHAALAGADEQAAADAGHALKPLKDAVEELGLFALIVHHPGKDLERGARGSSALRAAVDTEIELRVPGFDGSKAKPAAIPRRGTLTKQRDGAVGAELHYRLNVVELGRDEDDEPWTTCIVSPCEAADGAGRPKNKTDARLAKALGAAVAEACQERVEMKAVRGFFNNSGPPSEKEEARRKAFRRSLDKAVKAGLVHTDSVEQFLWFSNSARDAGQRDTP